MAERNLLLHYFPKVASRPDLEAIAERIGQRAPEIHVEVLATTQPHPVTMVRATSRPTLSVEFNRAKYFRLLRGRALRQWYKSPKSKQYRVLGEAVLPVPKWAKITPDLKLDPAEWGDYVIEKPDRGTTGNDVSIVPTNEIRYRPPKDMEKGHSGRVAGMLVQRLVYTGERPVSHRVATLFGTPIIALRYEGGGSRLFADGGGGARIPTDAPAISIAEGSRITTFHDEEILALARKIHAAFPDVPVLGTDIIRNPDDGSLWILEVNPDGNSWPLGSEYGLLMMERDGVDLYGQFNGLDLAADVLIDRCRSSAV
ncbi:MAG: hypothetical protein AAF414_06345 [Pseudomonadota bacterium]